MLASYRGHVETVEMLLEYSSDVNLTTEVDHLISCYCNVHFTLDQSVDPYLTRHLQYYATECHVCCTDTTKLWLMDKPKTMGNSYVNC